MNYAGIKPADVANGTGVRVSLFVSGCTHHCKDCFNEEAWDFAYGEPFTKETEDRLLTLLKPDYISGLSLLGGEPMEPENQAVLLPFLRQVRRLFPTKTIWCYSGYELEYMLESMAKVCGTTRAMLECLDVLVDGRFVAELKNLNLPFRGSENQRILDMKKSLASGKGVSYDFRSTLE